MDNFLNGVLPLYKPPGMTSMEAGRRIKKYLPKKQKIGHLGTLDPMAEGVLPLLLGEATKFFDILITTPKAYEFEVSLGYETTTLDAEGETIKTGGKSLFSADLLTQALLRFTGGYDQVPPLYSALKHKGIPLYKYAQQGTALDKPIEDLKKKFVKFYDLKILSVNNNKVLIYVCCSKGTYVRSLARDFAYHLGTFGTVTQLKRTKSGGFCLSDCVALPMECGEDLSLIKNSMIPLKKVPLPHPKIFLTDKEMIKKIGFGNALKVCSDDPLIFEFLKNSPPPYLEPVQALFCDEEENLLSLGAITSPAPHDYFMLQVTRGFKI